MKDFKRILVPVDGSELSELAFKKALSLVELIDGKLTVLHVIEPVSLSYTGFEGAEINSAITLIESESVNAVEKYLKKFKKMGKENDIIIDTVIAKGNISSEIVEASDDFDLIVMGSQGRNMITSLLLGSVAEYVSRHACCPVMLVRPTRKGCKKK
ncbi:MAG: universal stress protein [Candidatus Thermoplasmatota archaeon]|nr:universal stress protein [Candidatus Thermoplasmatota archaeon]